MFEALKSLMRRDRNAPAERDRRSAPRVAVDRPAVIHPFDVYADVMIKNASSTGMMGKADVRPRIGQEVHVSVDQKEYYSGVVRWLRDKSFGVEWTMPNAMLPVPERFDAPAAPGQKPRAVRVALSIPAVIAIGRAPLLANVINISSGGMMIETDADLREGQHLLVRVGELPLLRCRVQWSDGNQRGLMFSAPMLLERMLTFG